MQATAHLRHLRMSPRKVRLVAGLIRGMDVAEADAQLRHFPKAAALPLRKLLASAVANAEHNAKLTTSNLFVGQIFVNQGPTLKRFRPRAFGRAASIRKRTSHVTIVLDERVPTRADSRKPQAASVPPPVVMSERPRAAKKGVGHVHDEAEKPTKEGAEASEPMDVRRKGKHRHQEHEDARSVKKSGGFLKRLINRRLGEK